MQECAWRQLTIGLVTSHGIPIESLYNAANGQRQLIANVRQLMYGWHRTVGILAIIQHGYHVFVSPANRFGNDVLLLACRTFVTELLTMTIFFQIGSDQLFTRRFGDDLFAIYSAIEQVKMRKSFDFIINLAIYFCAVSLYLAGSSPRNPAMRLGSVPSMTAHKRTITGRTWLAK